MPDGKSQATALNRIEPGDGPNLLFLFSDQHAQRVTHCYGDPVVQTPNLDRLSSEGATFDNCYTPSPICVPARMSMLTGRHPHEQACWTNDDILASDIPTWPQALGASGVHTALIGRLHTMGPDQMRGYAEREVGDHSPNWPGVPRHDMGVLEKTNDPNRESIEKSGAGNNAYQDLDEATATAAENWLRRWSDARSNETSNKRFALTVGFMLPHAPFVARREDFERYEGHVPPPRLGPPNNEHPWLAWWRGSRQITDVPATARDRARAAYYGLVTHLDRLIGRVLSALEETGLAESTIVVYSSDHGEQIGERGLWWKHTFYDDSAKVPLIIRWPGKIPAGERRSHVVSLQDVAGTMLEAMGAPSLPKSNGRSFLTVARSADQPWSDIVHSEYCTDSVPDWTGGMAVQQRMVRMGRWKLIVYNGYPEQLFDLEADPDEMNDIAGSSAHAPILENMKRLLFSGWDPERVAQVMRQRRASKDLQAAWARNVNPPDSIRFQTTPQMNVLDDGNA